MLTTSNRRWWALAVLMLPVLLISMDATILGFAVPVLSEQLGPTSTQLLWIVDIYSFVLAGLLVTMGVLGDRIGRRRLLLIGAAGFSAASLIAAFSTSAGMLMVARALLGLAGSTLMPSTLSLIRNIFPDDRERQTAIALWATAFAVGTTLGPILGGVLLEHFWWGSIFIVNVPVTLVLVVAAPRLIDESRDPSPGRFDLASVALSMATMFPVIWALKSFAAYGASRSSAVWLGVGIVAGVAFVRRQRRLADPMIDVGLFRLPLFRMAVTGNLVSCFALAGSLFMITQYLQLVLGLSALAAGVALLPSSLLAAIAMLASPAAARRFGIFAVIAVGLGAGAVGFVLLTLLHASASPVLAVAAVAVLNAGVSAAMTVAVDGILVVVPPERAGAGAAVSETANELGIALGTAILGSILTALYRPRIDALDAPGASLDVARESLGAAIVASRQVSDQAAAVLADGARAAFLAGIDTASVVGAVALGVVAVWAALGERARRRTMQRT